MKPSMGLIPLTLVAFLACNKVKPKKFADAKEVTMEEVKNILQEVIRPINMQSEAAKKETLQNIVVDEGIIRGFKRTPPLYNKLTLAQKTCLWEVLTGDGVVMHDADGNEVHRSPKAHCNGPYSEKAFSNLISLR